MSHPETFDREKYIPSSGVVPTEFDTAPEDHDLKVALGDEEHRAFEHEELVTNRRFAFRYTSPRASIRELLANAETAIIRRAKRELQTEEPDVYTDEHIQSLSPAEILEKARTVAGYVGSIEVYHSHHESLLPDFVISDNGIGMSVEEFLVFRTLGLSASHDEGDQAGEFGQGIMSTFNLCGEDGTSDWLTHSMLDDANYRFKLSISGTNDEPGRRDGYGTTVRIPSFCSEARDMDVEDTLGEYTEGLRVGVIYHEYDSSGEETHKEEFPTQGMEEAFPDEAITVTYEDDYIEAVSSPAVTSGSRDPRTYMVSMPIDRYDGSYSSATKSRDAPWEFDVRFKYEDGRVYRCHCEDADHTGLVPISRGRYEKKLLDAREGYITEALLSAGDTVGYETDGEYLVPDDQGFGELDEMLTERNDVTIIDADATPEGTAVVIDGEHAGREIISEERWDDMDDGDADYIPKDAVEEDTLLPKPVDDRDRVHEHDGEALQYVSEQLQEAFRVECSRIFSRLKGTGFESMLTWEGEERALLLEAYERFGPSSDMPNAQTVIDTIRESLWITIGEDLAEKLGVMDETVSHAPRDGHRVNKQSGRDPRNVQYVLEDASTGDVYMGVTINRDKAELAWALDDDNQVVSIDGTDDYERYSDLFGWKRLKDLSLYDISDRHPQVDDATIQKIEKTHYPGGGHSSSGSLDSPGERRVKVRTKKRGHGSFREFTAQEISDALEGDDGYLEVNRRKIEYVLVYRQTEHEGVTVGHEYSCGNIARVVVPNYVADYLLDADRVFESFEEINEESGTDTVDVYDISPYADGETPGDFEPTEVAIEDLGPETVIFFGEKQLMDVIESSMGVSDTDVSVPIEGDFLELFVEELEDTYPVNGDIEQIAFPDPDLLDKNWLVLNGPSTIQPDATENTEPVPQVFGTYDASMPRDVRCVEKRLDRGTIILDAMLPADEFPRDAPEWKALMWGKRRNIKRYDQRFGVPVVTMLRELADSTDDDTPAFPSQR